MNMPKEITLIDISVKARSKKEVYLVLTVEGGLYLPPILDSNRKYLKDIISGKKKFLYSKNIKCIKVPQIKCLSIKDILVFAKTQTNIEEYLPTYEYNKFPNRDWLCNVINTIANEEFKEYVSNAMNQREKSILLNRGLQVDAIPEIISIFSHSKNVSLMKGRTHFLLRKQSNFRKRTLLDREMEDAEERKEITKGLTDKIKELEQEIEKHQNREELFLQDKEKLVKLYERGAIDSDGELIENDDE